MTVTILLIALAHGIPVFLAGAVWNTKLSVTLAAIIMCVIAIATGGVRYAIFDLVVIGIVYFLCIGAVGESPRIKHEPPPKPLQEEPAKPKSDESWSGVIIGLIMVGIFLYLKSADKDAPSPPPVVQVPQQASFLQKPKPSADSERSKSSSKHRTVNRSNSDLRHCLNLPTNVEIMRCANQ